MQRFYFFFFTACSHELVATSPIDLVEQIVFNSRKENKGDFFLITESYSVYFLVRYKGKRFYRKNFSERWEF